MEQRGTAIFKQENLRFLKVTFFSALVLLLETVLFNMVNFIYDYFIATVGLGFVIIGIGLGAFAASRRNYPEESIFTVSCAGTTIFIFITYGVIIYSYPFFWIGAVAIALCIFFPVFYISSIFKNHRGNLVYMFDMSGAFLGVILTIIVYSIFHTESILFFIAFIVPLVGYVDYQMRKDKKSFTGYVLLVFVLLGFYFYISQIHTDCFNLFVRMQKLERKVSDFHLEKAFRPQYKFKTWVKTYDNLRGRLDILKILDGRIHQVAYDGTINDHFNVKKTKDWDSYYGPRNLEWPSDDIRVLYGLVKEPKICIIGAAAQGIIKTVKEITPAENITGIEINPAIITIMTKDYYKESGYAYRNLKPVIGNAISILKSSKKKFDIITMINTHSSRTISYPGPPNYLHTLENYIMFLNHLTDNGYILFEERPITENGQKAFYRQLKTIYRALKENGAVDPEKHFVIWEWMAKGVDKMMRYTERYYISMIVTKKPITDENRQKIIRWLTMAVNGRAAKGRPTKLMYLKGFKEDSEINDIFELIRTGSLHLLDMPNFDTSIATNNRPFIQMGERSNAWLNNLLLLGGLTALILWIVLTLGLISGPKNPVSLPLNIYNVLGGMAYFLIEIMFLQIYQNIFFAAATTLVFILGVLLLSSGIGGLLSEKFSLKVVTLLLIPCIIVTIFAPGFLLGWSIPAFLIKIIAVVLIGLNGFCMGVYFPKGLAVAAQNGLQAKIPYLFGINCTGGSFAVVLALWLGMTVGYVMSVGVAIVLYIIVTLLLMKLSKKA